MRILLLTHRMPFPPNKGDKVRSHNILSYLTQRHEVYLASLIDDRADLEFVPQVEARVRGFLFECIGRRARTALASRALLRARSITVTYFYSRKLQTRIDALIDELDFDVFFCFSAPMAEYLFRSRHAHGRLSHAVKVMDLIDVDSYKWRQYAENSSPWTAWIYRHEARQMAAYEQRIAAEFERVYLVSEQEKSHFPAAHVRNLYALSNGVDLEFFSPAHSGHCTGTGPTLVFTGTMDYWPNIEGVRWFVEQVYPRIRAAVPDLRFFIVGSRPTAEVRRLSAVEGVVVTGFVDDVRDYLAGASACVVPLRIARGIQNKVLEAMAMGKAVLCTPQAVEGIRAHAGEHIVVAEGEDAFAAAAVELLKDRAAAERVGRNARRCVEEHYSWRDNLRLLTDFLDDHDELEAAASPGAG